MEFPRYTVFASALLTAVLASVASPTALAQLQTAGRNLNIASVNLDNKAVLRINFPALPCAAPAVCTPSDYIGNTDQNSYVRPQSLAFVTNVATSQLDLLIADNQRGTIYRYPGALSPNSSPPALPPAVTSATLVWNSNTAANGPLAPNAMATDSLGNLIVVNSTSGHSTNPQLWLFPVGNSGPGSFGTPVRLDGTNANNSFQGKEALLEVVFAPTDVAGANGVVGGDLIVLTTSRVLAYSRASGFTSRITLLNFPANGSPVPGGMDFWPFGNGGAANYSLLISSSGSGTISRYYFTYPLTPAPAFTTGLVSPYRIKTLFQAGNSLLFVSQTGAVLEYGAAPDGSGVQLQSVTQNVTSPQGLAVSNDFTGQRNTCWQQNGGCNLTGLLGHIVNNIPVPNTNDQIVEDVCTVNADPRVNFNSGPWSCSTAYTPKNNFTCPQGSPNCLPVNDVCPGFDDTNKMVLPGSLCGRSGKSGAAFTLIKTLTDPTVFQGGLIENAAVLADGHDPDCGPSTAAARDGAFLWAPLAAEGLIAEGGNMVDMTDGCGSVHSSNGTMSLYAVGTSINEAATDLTAPGLRHALDDVAQIKYQNLTGTIASLNNAVPNITPSLAALLWAGNTPPSTTHMPPGCLDKSWQLFYNATVVDPDGSPQWRADLQNAANLLTDADLSNGNLTCDAIAQANQSGFMQSSNPTVLNPFGRVRGRLANLYYSVNVRLLGNAAATHWPLPVSVNVVPTAVTLASPATNGSATLYWNTHGDTGCTLISSDGYYPAHLPGGVLASPQALTIPATDAAQSPVSYTVSCSGIAGDPPSAATTATAWVTVTQPPTLTVTPQAATQGGAVTLSWSTNGALGCQGSSNDTVANDAAVANFNGASLNGNGSITLNPSAAGSYTYTMACTTPATSASATVNVVRTPSLGLSSSTVTRGSGVTLSWNEYGNTGCTWTSNDGSFSAPTTVSGTQTVAPLSAGNYTYTLSCSTPTQPSQTVALTVYPQAPSITLSQTPITLGSSSTLSWAEDAGSACAASSSGTDTNLSDRFSGPVALTGSMVLTPNAVGTDTYTLTCTNPPNTARSAALTVNPLPANISISVSTHAPLFEITDSAKLNWTLSGGTIGCQVSGQWPPGSVPQFSPFAVSASGSRTVNFQSAGNYTYTLSCTNPVTPAQTTINVAPTDLY